MNNDVTVSTTVGDGFFFLGCGPPGPSLLPAGPLHFMFGVYFGRIYVGSLTFEFDIKDSEKNTNEVPFHSVKF